MQNTSLFLVFLHQLGQFVLDICIEGKDILQFSPLDRWTIVLFVSFYFNLLEFLYALLCLYVDINAYHFISENYSECISFDPRSVRPRLQRTHPDFLDHLCLNVEFYFWRVDFGEAK